MNIKHSPLVIWDVVDGETTLCHTGSGEVFSLSETGALIWTACHNCPLEAVVHHLGEAYCGEDQEKLAADAHGFILTLEGAGLVEVDQELIPA